MRTCATLEREGVGSALALYRSPQRLLLATRASRMVPPVRAAPFRCWLETAEELGSTGWDDEKAGRAS